MSVFKAIGQAVTGSFLEKPAYEVIQKTKDYEERHYPASKWVSTSVQSMVHEKARGIGFQRLFKYITGQNDKETKIDMTAPVATKIVPGAGPNCESTFTVSFYIPPVHQENPPKPSNEDVFIEKFPEMTVLARSFGGFANDEKWINEARNLAEAVEGTEKFHSNFYYTAGYDSPYKLFNRLNEVWFVKE